MTFVLESRPTKLPRKCATCGSSTLGGERKYIDLNVSVDRFGRLYICTGCVKDIANLLKLIPEKDLAVANSKYHHLLDKYNEQNIEMQELRNALDTLRRLDNISADSERSFVPPDEALSGTSEGDNLDKGQSDRESVKSFAGGESRSVSETAKLLKFS